MSGMINGLFPGVIKPDKTLAGCVDVYENIWKNPLQTIADVEKECFTPNNNLYWTKAGISSQYVYDQNERTNYDMNLTYQSNLGNPVAQKIHNEMYMLLMSTAIDYNKRYGVHNNLWHEEYNMLKYSFGQEYHSHYDGNTGSGRSLSAILYLNDDYEGGHIEFVNFNITIKPTAGMLLLFPSNYAYRHKAYPVTSGTKYAIVTWLHDRPIENEKEHGVE
jgi:hypothetical protein